MLFVTRFLTEEPITLFFPRGEIGRQEMKDVIFAGRARLENVAYIWSKKIRLLIISSLN